jgi:FixJ family two-component response regulator
MSDKTRILCVDDERNVLRSLERIFIDDDYLILTANSGEEGLELLSAAPQVQVVISDFRMPGMNGVEFLKQVFMRHPDTIRIVLSGFPDMAAVVAAINEGKIYKFIPKPWNDDDLRMTVAKALEHFATNRNNVSLARELQLRNEELRELNANLEQLVSVRTSELLLQNRALLHARTILDHLPFGVLGLAADGIVVQLNREAALLLDLAPDRVLGAPMREVLAPEISALVSGSTGGRFDYRTLTVNGTRLQVKGISMAGEGEAGYILIIVRASQF